MDRRAFQAVVLATMGTSACGGFGSQPPEQLPIVKDADGGIHRLAVKGPYRAYYNRNGLLERIEYDSNGDKARDRIVYYSDGKNPRLIEVDTDLDGHIDRWEEYASGGEVPSRIGTASRGSVPDRWATLGANGQVERFEYDANHDTKTERAEWFKDGRVVRVEVDTDGDGRFDRWQDLGGGRLSAEDLDVDADGKPDHRLRYAADGRLLGIERLKR